MIVFCFQRFHQKLQTKRELQLKVLISLFNKFQLQILHCFCRFDFENADFFGCKISFLMHGEEKINFLS